MEIKKVAVIGAGTMGAGIAGQVANAGVEVVLLDLPGEHSPTEVVERGLERLRDPGNPGFMSPEAEELITIGNIHDNFDLIADCDLIAEAIVERLDLKKDLYKRISEVCRPDAIVSSNTSTIPIKLLVEDMPTAFRERFAITHFFNPVRFMPLLELVRGEDTAPEVMTILDAFCDQHLGKGVIHCLDTPGFLGNRIGVFAIQCALHAALDMDLSPVEADAIFGRPMGIPKTGVFGLYDLIGIDLMSDVAKSLVSILPESDPFHAESAPVPRMMTMIENGHTGNKKGQGFYRKTTDGLREVINIGDGSYASAPRLIIPLAENAEQNGIIKLLEDQGKYGQYAWRVLSRTLCYAASLIPEVGNDPQPLDDAMKLGYNWIKGPFELIDEIGTDYLINRLEDEGREVPEFLRKAAGSTFYRVEEGKLQSRRWDGSWETCQRPEGIIRFNETRKTLSPVNENASASWFDLDGIAMVEFHSKANALDADSMFILADALDHADSGKVRGLIVHNDAQHFSCGVNLQSVRKFFESEDMDGLDKFLDHFQQTVHRMSVADYPTVAAPVGLSLGGGFEVVLHARHVICHANSTTGLVESGVGVIPGGGGCKETLYRWGEKLGCTDDISEASWKAFMNLGYGTTAPSPLLSKKLAMLRDSDRYLNNRDRLLGEAIKAVDDPSTQSTFNRPALKMPGQKTFDDMRKWLDEAHAKGKLTPHNVVVATEIARIVTGGDVPAGTELSEQDLYDAERKSFLTLVSTQATRDRITSMLDTGSAVQN